MATTMPIADAQARLKELIDSLKPGEDVILTENQQPVARIVREVQAKPERPAPGLGKGSVLYIAPDFDATPEEFEEYVE